MIRVEPATRDRWADVAEVFEGDGPAGCWCQYWRRSSGEYREGRRLDVAFSYVGFTPMFNAAGFETVSETAARSAGRPRWLMRLDLAG